MANPKAARTRSAILATSLELFLDGGYAGTRLSDIAEPLQLTRAALYYHFRSKDELLLALVGPYLDELEALAAHGGAPPLADDERLEVLHAIADLFIANLPLVRWVAQDVAVRNHPAIGPRLAAATSQLRRLLAASDADRDIVRASSALGALRRPLLQLAHLDVSVLRDQLIDDAASVLKLRT